MQIWTSYPFCASSPESVCMHTWVEAWGDALSVYLGPELRYEGGEQNYSDLLRNCPCHWRSKEEIFSFSIVIEKKYKPRFLGYEEIWRHHFFIVDNRISMHIKLWSENESLRNFFVLVWLSAQICWALFFAKMLFTEKFSVHSNPSGCRIEMSFYYENEVS